MPETRLCAKRNQVGPSNANAYQRRIVGRGDAFNPRGPKIAVALQRLVDWALKDELITRMAQEDGQQATSWGQGPRR
jgi:hypothetical protein